MDEPGAPASDVEAPPETPPAERRRFRLRPRVAAVALLAVAVVASGVALDRAVSPRAAAQATVVDRAQSGAWYCPHGGGTGWQGWVAIANPGERSVRIRLTELSEMGIGHVSNFSVGPLRLVYRAVAADSISNATQVEYFGGWVGVSAVVMSSLPASVAAERCAPSGSPQWILPDEPTTTGQSAYVVVMNPFDHDASFDLTFATEQRRIELSELSPVVLKPHTSMAVHVNQYALAGQDEHTVTATVTEVIGRVVAGGIVMGPDGIRGDVGVPGGTGQTALPAARYSGSPEVLLLALGEDRADLSIISAGRSAERVVSGPDQLSLSADEARTVSISGLPDAGVVVDVSGGGPVAAALRLRGTDGQVATLNGGAVPGTAWMVLPTVPPEGGQAYLVLQNVGSETADASVELVGTSGLVPSTRLESVHVAPGRTVWFRLSRASRVQPVAAVVTVHGGTLVAAGASYSRTGPGFAATLGVPMTG
jgi:Family of unknown function (DUF5719)